MRRVWVFSRWGIALALVSAVAFLLLVSSDSSVEATHKPYAPTYSVSLSDPERNANANVAQTVGLTASEHFFDQAIFFWDPRWNIAPDGSIPNGAIAGSLVSFATLGILNSGCFIPVPVAFSMQEASTNQAVTVSQAGGFLPDPGNPGLTFGVTKYSDFLNIIFPPAVVGAPLERQFGAVNLFGTNVGINVVIFPPGAFSLLGFPASLGYPMATVLDNPVGVPMPGGLITDNCTPNSFTVNTFGITKDNPATVGVDESGFAKLTNPSCNSSSCGAYIFALFASPTFDADGDGLDNNNDTCPFAANVEVPHTLPFGHLFVDIDGDGIDAACDVVPFAAGPLAPFVNAGPDADFDGFLNRGDHCPQTFDPLNLDADGDHIGDLCDPNPGVPDGIGAPVTLFSPVEIERHGVKLNALGGPKQVKEGTSKTYTADVSNLSNSHDQDIVVKFSVAGCAGTTFSPSSPATVTVPVGDSGAATFTVDFGACAGSTAVITADACHAGDPGCAGTDGPDTPPSIPPHSALNFVDPNPSDDAPRIKSVNVN